MDMVSEKKDWTSPNSGNPFYKLVNTLSNEQDVLNETLQICTDFIGMLRHSAQQSESLNDIDAPIYFSQDQFNIEPFSERFDSVACGWTFTLTVLVQNDFQTCDIPVA